MARTAIHKLLIAACERTGGIPRGMSAKGALVSLLTQRGAIDPALHDRLRRLFRIANRAAHGSRVTGQQVFDLIAGVREVAGLLPR